MSIKRLENKVLGRITAGIAEEPDDTKGKYGKVLGGMMASIAGQQGEILKRVGHTVFVNTIKHVLEYGKLPDDGGGRPGGK